jgi:hypothetical protein
MNCEKSVIQLLFNLLKNFFICLFLSQIGIQQYIFYLMKLKTKNRVINTIKKIINFLNKIFFKKRRRDLINRFIN